MCLSGEGHEKKADAIALLREAIRSVPDSHTEKESNSILANL
jgi:hypothetical protein